MLIGKRSLANLESNHIKTEGLLSEYEHKRDIMCTILEKMSIFPSMFSDEFSDDVELLCDS